MKDANLNTVISSLELLSSSLQETADHEPANIDSKLRDVALQASRIITTALPSDQQAAWLSELDSLAGPHCPQEARVHPENQRHGAEGTHSGAKKRALSCRCDTKGAHGEQRAAECIHGCGALFCSAACRKQIAREHARVCSALERRRLLRGLGLSGGDELF